MSTDFTVRDAYPVDLDAIMELLKANERVFGLMPRLAVLSELEGTLKPSRKCWFVAERDGQVLGVVYCFHTSPWGSLTYVNYLCTAEDARGDGVGKTLLEHVYRQAVALGQQGITFTCPEGNPANHLYARWGYELVGREAASRNFLLHWQRTPAS